jgi:formiminotetrahydrofolate cyclodeaminase
MRSVGLLRTQLQFLFFKQIVLAGVNRDSAVRASMHLLDAIKIPKTTENEKKTYRWLLNELRSESIRRKLNAIAKIEKIRTVK